MTILYFLRHATAELLQPGMSDSDRCLVLKGQQQAAKVAQFMLAHRIQPDMSFTSCYPRAKQTAAIVCQQMLIAPAEEVSWLNLATPQTHSLPALRQLTARYTGQQVLLVGHEPDLSLLISRLLGTEHALLKIRKASLTCLVCLNTVSEQHHTDTEKWYLNWSVPAKLMQ